jgi:hypothetical protein
MSHLTPRTAARRRIAAALLTATVSFTAAGCGSTPPLENLSTTQRDQLDQAWTARISATDTAEITGAARNERAKALYAACKGLDPTSELLAAVAALCGPTSSNQKLTTLLPDRCSKPAAICVRALDRIAAATEQEGQLLQKVSEEAKKVISDPTCLRQLTIADAQVDGYGDLAAAYRVVALGVEQKDEEIAALGQRKIDDAKAFIAPKGTIATRTAAFRADCMQQG